MTPKTDPDRPPATLDRRTLVGLLGGAGLAALAGCTGGDAGTAAATPTPIDLDGGKTDDQGGMVIGEHYGPNGQIFYRDHAPEGHDNPAWFHTLAAGLFPYYFEHERLGWEAVAIYVTDYSRVDYELVTPDDRTLISTHTAAETFGEATAVDYVAGSRVLGGMGPELIPFGDPDDAEAFREEHGGALVGFDDVSEQSVLHLGHDHGHRH